MNSIYFLSIFEDGIVLSQGDRVWFYGWYDVGRIYEDFSEWN
jgi:hypothetical protein